MIYTCVSFYYACCIFNYALFCLLLRSYIYYSHFCCCVYCRSKLEQKFFDDNDDVGASSIKKTYTRSFVVNIMILVFIYCTFIVIEWLRSLHCDNIKHNYSNFNKPSLFSNFDFSNLNLQSKTNQPQSLQLNTCNNWFQT